MNKCISKAREELGKGLITLANMLLVLFLLNTYLQKENINYWIIFLSVYGIGAIYFIGYNLIKENCDE